MAISLASSSRFSWRGPGVIEPERPGHPLVAAAAEEGRGYDGPMARSLRLDHARALLQANLLEEAREIAVGAVIESDEARPSSTAESLLVAAEAHLAGGDIRHGDRGRRAPARSTPSNTAVVSGMGSARRSCARSRAVEGPTIELAGDVAANAAVLDSLGCRTDALQAPPLGSSYTCRLGDLDGAEELMPARTRTVRSTVVHQPSALRVRALLESARGNRAGARRAVNLGVRLLHRPPGRARGTQAARLRHGRRRALGEALPAGDRGRTPTASCSPSSRRPVAPRRC